MSKVSEDSDVLVGKRRRGLPCVAMKMKVFGEAVGLSDIRMCLCPIRLYDVGWITERSLLWVLKNLYERTKDL